MDKLFFSDGMKIYKAAELFPPLYEVTIGKTMIEYNKLKNLYEFAVMTKLLDGDVADAGVWEGGSTYILASVLADKIIHAFDSWDGLPEPTKEDLVELDEQPMQRGWGKCNPPKELLKKFGDRVVLHKGWFCDTLDVVSDKKFCLVHIDCDQYRSVKECVEFFYPRMVKGGIMIFDDYGFVLTPGATKAVDDFFIDKFDKIAFVVHAGLYVKVI